MIGGRAALASAFESQTGMASSALVRIESRVRGRRQRCLGLVVAVGTFVVSKSSRVGDARLKARLADGATGALEPVRRERTNDLVLLRMVEGRGTPAIWADAEEAPAIGSLVAAPTKGAEPALAVGVVSITVHGTARVVHGDLGILTRNTSDGGARVILVEREGAAKRAGIRTRDRIERVGDAEVHTTADLDAALAATDPGDEVELAVRRGDEFLTLSVVLGRNAIVLEEEFFVHVADDSTVSVRRGGFARVLRHDVPLSADECGGPLVDLAGRVIGLNISRPDRVGALALPASVVLAFLNEQR